MLTRILTSIYFMGFALLFLTLQVGYSQNKITSKNIFDDKSKVFEMRIYYTNEGKMDALLNRFRNHTTKLFKKHGMKNVGYWVAKDNPNKLIYILSYANMAAREKSWKSFKEDPVWIKVAADSELEGKILKKIESEFMYGLDFSNLK